MDNWSFDSLEDVVSRYLDVFPDPDDTVEKADSESEKEKLEDSEIEEEQNHDIAQEEEEEEDSDEDPLGFGDSPEKKVKEVEKVAEVEEVIEAEDEPQGDNEDPGIGQDMVEEDIAEDDDIDPKFPRSYAQQRQIDDEKKRVESKLDRFFMA